MLKKFLREVVIIVVGKHAEEIVDLLESKKHVNEFIIAKKLDITINQTRNILYKISNYGLVSFIRKKDKKKGWYTYFWKFEILKCLEFLRNILIKRIEQINNQIKSRQTKEFYICERCNIEFSGENALLHNFICNECGDVFVMKDNNKILREFNRELDKAKKELELVDEEIKKERQGIDQIRLKEIKKKEKEKKIKKELNKKRLKDKRVAEKNKTEKKKPTKKKVSKKVITQQKGAKKKPTKKKTIKVKSAKKKGKK